MKEVTEGKGGMIIVRIAVMTEEAAEKEEVAEAVLTEEAEVEEVVVQEVEEEVKEKPLAMSC